jgi:HemX protein
MLADVVRWAVFPLLLAASVLFIASFYRPALDGWARVLLWGAFVLTTADLVHDAVAVHGFPVVTVASFAELFVWMATGAFLVAVGRGTFSTVGGFVVPVLAIIWLVGQLVSPMPGGRLPAAFTGVWLVLHVVLAAASYTAFILSLAASLMYLEKERELRRKTPRVFYYRLPALRELDAWAYRSVAIGLPLLVAAMATGAVWSRAVSGLYWTWSPKEIASVVTGAAYLGYLVTRWAGWSGHRAAWASMAAFLLVAANVFGVTLIFHGWHDFQG